MQFWNKDDNYLSIFERIVRKTCICKNFMSIIEIEFEHKPPFASKPCLSF